MSNSVQAAVARLHWQSLLRLYGEKVTYVRGDLSIELTAVPAKPRAQQVSAGDQVVLSSKQLDWLIAPGDLVDGETEIEPKRGDKIVRANTEVCRVSPAGGGDDVWRWGDACNTWRRVQSEEK